MRIGILTRHRVFNYGSVLQAFALFYIIEKFGHQVDIVDYWRDVPKYPSFYKKIIKYIRYFPSFFSRRKRLNKFSSFLKSYLQVNGDKLFSQGVDMPLVYDRYIFGSDQIWRYFKDADKIGFDDVYWGAYPPDKYKIAYAASMGSIPDDLDHINFIKQNLNNFSQISVREKHLQNHLQPHHSDFISHVLDPVFLLDKEAWKSLISQHQDSLLRIPQKKYLLFYHLVPSTQAQKIARYLCKKYDYVLVEIFGGDRPYNFFNNYYQSAGPLDFINLIYNANYVVSTSFHGTAFSILFEKQFYSAGMDDNSSRAKSLLDLFGIPERYIEGENRLFDARHNPIRYSQIQEKISSFRSESITFLKKHLYEL